MKKLFPSLPELGRETLIVLGGAIIAAFIVGQSPALKAWIREQWGDTPRPL